MAPRRMMEGAINCVATSAEKKEFAMLFGVL